MNSVIAKLPKKGGGQRLRKIYEDNKKKSKPSPELLEILRQQKVEEEKEKNKKSAIEKDIGV